MEKQFDFGKTIRFLKNNPIIKKKKIQLLKKNSIIKIKSILKKTQFEINFFHLEFFFSFLLLLLQRSQSQIVDVKSQVNEKKIRFLNSGKTIRLWKNNSIMEQNSILKTNQFGNQIYIFNFEFFFYFFRFKELGGRNSTDSGLR